MRREWFRAVQWPAGDEEGRWGPVIARAAKTWDELEVISVTEGLRPSALVYLTPEDMPRATRDAVRAGLSVTAVAPGRFALHLQGLERSWVEAGQDTDLVGRLLGYPDCCRAHFADTWARGADHLAAMPKANGPWTANVFLRTLGVRLVPWLPCSADCPASVDFAERLLTVGVRVGLDVAPLEALLRLPATWDALNGVAVITTPVFRLCVSCDVREGHEVRMREGRVELPPPAIWEDNGFTSERAMVEAHDLVLRVVGPAESALDLGCGDGTLLARLAAGRGPREAWTGVEKDPRRASVGAARHPGVVILEGDIRELGDWGGPPVDVALLSARRILEMPESEREGFRRALRASARRIVASSYGDGGEPLDVICALAGLSLSGPVTCAGVVQAVEVIPC